MNQLSKGLGQKFKSKKPSICGLSKINLKKFIFMKKNKELNFAEINNFIFLGGSPSLLDAAEYLISKDIPVVVFSSDRLLQEKIDNTYTLEAKLSRLGIQVYNSSEIKNDKRLEASVNDHTLGISFGSPWIIKQETINLFRGKLLNLHEMRLPENRGGGGYSWLLLMNERRGQCTLHLVDTGIDSGDIVYFRTFHYPHTFTKPIQYYQYTVAKDRIFMRDFIDLVLSGATFKLLAQNEARSTYWPRLNTNLQGYINWEWTSEEVFRFICAFDDPYRGASTFLKSKRVFIKSASLGGKNNFHPFQSGLIFRSFNGLHVATRTGSLIIKSVFLESGDDITASVRVGDRFVTPPGYLISALEIRPVYTPEGLKNTKRRSVEFLD